MKINALCMLHFYSSDVEQFIRTQLGPKFVDSMKNYVKVDTSAKHSCCGEDCYCGKQDSRSIHQLPHLNFIKQALPCFGSFVKYVLKAILMLILIPSVIASPVNSEARSSKTGIGVAVSVAATIGLVASSTKQKSSSTKISTAKKNQPKSDNTTNKKKSTSSAGRGPDKSKRRRRRWTDAEKMAMAELKLKNKRRKRNAAMKSFVDALSANKSTNDGHEDNNMDTSEGEADANIDVDDDNIDGITGTANEGPKRVTSSHYERHFLSGIRICWRT